MLGRGWFYSCATHDWNGAEPCRECLSIDQQRTDSWRAANTKYDLLRRQYDDLAGDNGRLMDEVERLRTELERWQRMGGE